MDDIVLDQYSSAVFLAHMAYGNSKQKPPELKLFGGLKVEEWFKVKHTDEHRKKRWDAEKLRIDWIYKFLLENYPDKDYASRFLVDNSGWLQELKFPTEESKNCPHHLDNNHCSLNRIGGCYTCCFVCHSPKLCNYAVCSILKPNDEDTQDE